MPRRLLSFSLFALLGLQLSMSLCSAQMFRSIALQTKDLVYSRATGKIYASIPSTSPLYPNTITVIDPVTRGIDISVPIGNNPSQLALSDDGLTLYVAIVGGSAVRKFDTLTQTAGLQYTLGTNSGPNLVQDMGVLPGHPNSVAINMRNNGISPDFVGLGIFDEGVRRPNITAGYTSLAIASPTTIYAYNGGTTDFAFYGITVNADGAQRSFESYGLISGGGIGIKYDRETGLVYASNGVVVDPIARNIVGVYPDTGINSFLPDASRNNVYFISPSGGSTPFHFLIYDQSTFVPLASIPIPGLTSDAGSLLRLPNNRLAFRSNDRVYFVALPVSVSGMIALQETQNASQSVDFTFHPATGSAFTRTATLNFAGGYAFHDIPPNVYTVSIKGAKWLRKNITVDASTGNVTNANATLLAGDANDDNFVDIADLLLLISAYNQVSPNAGFLDAADFNCDEANDISDLLLLVANYNKQGDD